jgi:hypothetical protein
LLRLLLDAPQLAQAISPAQRALLETDPAFAPVLALVEQVQATGVTTTGALFEAARGSTYEELYAEVTREGLEEPSELEAARSDLEGVFTKLEAAWIQQQYQELLHKESRSDSERQRLRVLGERLAELKGVARVGVFPPT